MSFQNVSLLILLVAFEADDQDAKLHGFCNGHWMPLVIIPFGYVKCGCFAMSSICNPTRNQETELKSASRHQHCQVDIKK